MRSRQVGRCDAGGSYPTRRLLSKPRRELVAVPLPAKPLVSGSSVPTRSHRNSIHPSFFIIRLKEVPKSSLIVEEVPPFRGLDRTNRSSYEPTSWSH